MTEAGCSSKLQMEKETFHQLWTGTAQSKPTPNPTQELLEQPAKIFLGVQLLPQGLGLETSFPCAQGGGGVSGSVQDVGHGLG